MPTEKNIFVLAVAGGSCSGKTTFARKISEALGDEISLYITQDSYYHDQSAKFDHDGGSVNFDHPDSIDFPLMSQQLGELLCGNSIEQPIYDFGKHQRQQETLTLRSKSVIIVDGTLILQQEILHPHITHKVFISAPNDLRFERRLNRDTTERGRTPEGVTNQFNLQVRPMHDQFVEPSRIHADEIAEVQTFNEVLEKTVKMLQSWLKSQGK